MNGTGTMLWDNVFGTWVGYSEREKAILRAMLAINVASPHSSPANNGHRSCR